MEPWSRVPVPFGIPTQALVASAASVMGIDVLDVADAAPLGAHGGVDPATVNVGIPGPTVPVLGTGVYGRPRPPNHDIGSIRSKRTPPRRVDQSDDIANAAPR